MKVALIGASGNAGSRILRELVSRGHDVTAIARDASRIPTDERVNMFAADANDADALTPIIAGHDAVISSAMFTSANPKKLLDAVRKSEVKRYLVVGGAGTLEIAPGKTVIESFDLPPEYRPEVEGGRDFLNTLRSTTDIDWTFLSPALEFVPGERTGTFRTAKDELLTAADGSSRISFEDYAVALVDELEKPEHIKSRFAVAY